MTISSLSTYKNLTNKNYGIRTHSIDRITPHCVVGQCTAKSGVDYFCSTLRQCSVNYVIGKDGDIACNVEEEKAAWTSSNKDNDERAITIECASDTTDPYAFTDKCYKALIKLMVDICKRYNKTKIIWNSNKEQALSYIPKNNEIIITVHRWFDNRSCPGDWLFSRLNKVAEEVNKQIAKSEVKKLYRVQVGAFNDKSNAQKLVDKLKTQGYSAFIVEEGTSTNTNTNTNVSTLKVSDTVKLQKDAPVYGTTKKFASWVYDKILYVRAINGNAITISTLKSGDITGVVDKKYLTKI